MRLSVPPPPIDPALDDLVELLDRLARQSGDRRFTRASRELQRPAGAGQRSPATEKALRDRDDAIRQAATFFVGSRWRRCQQLHKFLSHYEATAWRLFDRHLEQMPPSYRDTRNAGAFVVLRTGQSVPGPRRLQAILRAG